MKKPTEAENPHDVAAGDEWEDRRTRSREADPLSPATIGGVVYPTINIDRLYEKGDKWVAEGTRSFSGRKTTIQLRNFTADNQLKRIRKGNK